MAEYENDFRRKFKQQTQATMDIIIDNIGVNLTNAVQQMSAYMVSLVYQQYGLDISITWKPFKYDVEFNLDSLKQYDRKFFDYTEWDRMMQPTKPQGRLPYRIRQKKPKSRKKRKE